MALRVPSNLHDESLLMDEPFKTRFALRRVTMEDRGKGRPVFYSDLETQMREKCGGVSFVFLGYAIRMFITLHIYSFMQLRSG